MKLALGDDFLWWLVPTRPELRTNYLERVWPKRQVKRMYIAEQFDMEQEEGDEDQKLYNEAKVKALFEKKLCFMLILVLGLLWVFVIQDLALEIGVKQLGWTRPDPLINVLPESQRI